MLVLIFFLQERQAEFLLDCVHTLTKMDIPTNQGKMEAR